MSARRSRCIFPTNTPTSGELFTIWAGANNLLIGNQTNPTVPAQDIANEITTLAAAGAKQFLIPNLPLLGEIPAVERLTRPPSSRRSTRGPSASTRRCKPRRPCSRRAWEYRSIS